MTYMKIYFITLKTHVVNLKRDANDLSRDLQRLEVPGNLITFFLFSLPLSNVGGGGGYEIPRCLSPLLFFGDTCSGISDHAGGRRKVSGEADRNAK